MSIFVERENVYTCQKCGGYTVTVDVEEGVTPFMIICRAKPKVGAMDKILRDGGIIIRKRHKDEFECDGEAHSAFYPKGPRPMHIPAPAWEWYKPIGDAYKKLSVAMKEHVDQGGLDLRVKQP